MVSNRARASGFSLLELIIVLMVMVSLLAIVWPSLEQPLRQTTLGEAAQTLRSAIDDSRYQAITTGAPVFVQLREGDAVVRSGSFDSFMNDEVDSASKGTSLQPATIARPSNDPLRGNLQPEVRKWTLPESVVISEVRWTLEPPPEELELSDASTSPSDTLQPMAEVQSDAMIATGMGGSDDPYGAAVGQTWWLPLVATGQGRDATIVLLDTSLDKEITVTFASATGALEIVK